MCTENDGKKIYTKTHTQWVLCAIRSVLRDRCICGGGRQAGAFGLQSVAFLRTKASSAPSFTRMRRWRFNTVWSTEKWTGRGQRRAFDANKTVSDFAVYKLSNDGFDEFHFEYLMIWYYLLFKWFLIIISYIKTLLYC